MSDASQAQTLAAPLQARFVHGPLRGHVVEMVLTGWASLLAVFAVEFLSLLYLGTLGEEAILAAVGLGSMTLFTVMSVSIGVTVGGAAMVSRALGLATGRARAPGRRLAHPDDGGHGRGGVLYLAFIGPYAAAVGLEPRVRGHLLSFVFISTPFMVAGGIGMMLSNLLRAHGRGRQSMWVLLAGTATVALLDPLVIFVFQGGLQGVAWAGAVGRLATMLLGGWLVFGRHRLVRWPTRGELRPALAAIGRIAAPAALTGLATPAAVIFAASTYAGFGSSVMAGATVMDRVLQLAYSMFFVLPGAIGPILGQNLGAGNWDRIRETARLTARLALAYGLGMAVLLALLAPFIADLFKVTGPGRDLVVFFCRYASFIWVLNSFFFVAVAVFNNLGHAGYSTAISWLRATVGTLPLVWLGARLGGPEGVVLGQSASFALFSLVALALCRRVLRRPPPRPAAAAAGQATGG